ARRPRGGGGGAGRRRAAARGAEGAGGRPGARLGGHRPGQRPGQAGVAVGGGGPGYEAGEPAGAGGGHARGRHAAWVAVESRATLPAPGALRRATTPGFMWPSWPPMVTYLFSCLRVPDRAASSNVAKGPNGAKPRGHALGGTTWHSRTQTRE